MTDDAELLRRYAEEKSEAAFGELVQRHIDFVYGAALRQVRGNAGLAQDVVQVVFTDFARKAATLARHEVIVGWLHTATRFAAGKAIRTEVRRAAREAEAQLLMMNSTTEETGAAADWERLHPALDAVLGELKERERAAILLRFFEKKPFSEVGEKLALTETAARSCVDRALEKMHGLLARRGVTSTSAALGLALANQAGVAAPVGLAASVSGAAAAVAAAGVASGGWQVVFMSMSKIKIGVTGAVVAAGLVTGVVEVNANRGLRAELRELQGGMGNVAALTTEGRQLNAALQKAGANNPEVTELARLRQRAAVLAARPPGVLDEAMIAAANWRDVGRATPEEANLTFHAAMFSRDPEKVAKFVSFDDDTPRNRAEFMAHFSEAVRAKFPTPEQIVAAAFFGAGTQVSQPPEDAFQPLGVDDHVGGNGNRYGQKRVRVWYRLASGREFEGSTRWQQTAEGWAPAPFSLAKEWEFAVTNFNPMTGERLPPKAGENAPPKN